MRQDYRLTIQGLCKMSRDLGYKDPCSQLINNDGSVVGDFLYFLEDNPGAIEAVMEWAADHYEQEEDEEEYEDEEG